MSYLARYLALSLQLLLMVVVCASLNRGLIVAAFSSTGIAIFCESSSASASSTTATSTTRSLAASSGSGSTTKLGVAQRISEDLGIFDATLPAYEENPDNVIPVTIISGFLGSGKTTLLQHLLENKSGDCPVGVIVNDVADVNIDGKLVKTMEQQDGNMDGLVELENGCACCALSDELLNGVSELVTLSDLRRSNRKSSSNDGSDSDNDGPNGHLQPFKHIVVEMSGVSDPRNIRATFQEAEQAGMVLMERIRLDTMVTVVDAEMFEEYFKSDKSASREQSPELFREEDVFEMEDWMKDVPPELLKAITGHRGMTDEESNGVAELLVGQTETADVILLNKCDLLQEDEKNSNSESEFDGGEHNNKKIKRLRELVKALNPRPTTRVLESSYGKVALSKILGVAKGEGVALSGAVDDHREFITAAIDTNDSEFEAEKEEEDSHEHEHHSHDNVATDTAAPDIEIAESSHEHSHDHAAAPDIDIDESSHEHSHNDHAATACADPVCTDPSHDHDHSHSHSEKEHASPVVEASTCNDPGCTEDHDHSHSHSSAVVEAEATTCNDPDCTEDHDHTHSHSHSHDHSHSHSHEENSTHAGIGTFVYRARRPFHPQRMLSFLRALPIARGIPESESDTREKEISKILFENQSDESEATAREVLKACLRSKGFVWCADSHSNSMYWSHAGASFEYKCLGRWWATLPRDQWPEGVDEYVLKDFDDISHPSEGMSGEEEEAPQSVGDRRQEVVFIGLGFGKFEKQELIRETLDRCLLTEEEYKTYRSICYEQTDATEDPDGLLHQAFPAILDSEYINY